MRVLLVEDDLQIGQSLMRALKDASYSVDWVRDGLAGRAAMDAAEYTVVLLDLGLPGMSGCARHSVLPSAAGCWPAPCAMRMDWRLRWRLPILKCISGGSREIKIIFWNCIHTQCSTG